MDIRAERTKNNIINAFIELRSKKEIEKITVKELANLSCINKATFYRHFEDIYVLSEYIENDLIKDCINSIPIDTDLLDKNGLLAMTTAFVNQRELFSIIFSGSRLSVGIQKLHQQVMERIYQAHPEFKDDLEKQIILSSAIYGDIYAYYQYKDTDFNFFIDSIVKLNHALEYILNSNLR